MPTFLYEASDSKGNISHGEVTALTKSDVVNFLSRRDLIPVSVEVKGEVQSFKSKFSFFSRLTATDKIMLTKHLSIIIKAGLNLREAIDILIADTDKPLLKKILSDIKFNLEKGQPFSATFAYYTKYFPPVFTGLIKAGEVSGNLDTALDQLGEHLTKENDLRNKVVSAMIYPAILLAATIGVVVLLLIFVLPKLTMAFGRGGVKIPWITKILMQISGILSANVFLTFGVSIGIIIFLFFFNRTVAGKKFFTDVINRTPIVRDLVKKIALTKFCRTLGTLLASGMPILEALQITAEVVGNDAYQRAILNSQQEIKRGISLGSSLKNRSDLFPQLLLGLVKVGEKTGTLEKILKTVSNFYDEEVDRILKNLVSVLEPALLLIMGLVIGGIAISVMLPIYQMIGALR